MKEPDFESGASTSSATPAREAGEYSRGVVYCEQIFAVGRTGGLSESVFGLTQRLLIRVFARCYRLYNESGWYFHYCGFSQSPKDWPIDATIGVDFSLNDFNR